MPVIKKRFSCRHRGFGAFCHRCEQADQLEEMLAQGKKHVTHDNFDSKGQSQKKVWTKKEMHDEAKRLREVGG